MPRTRSARSIEAVLTPAKFVPFADLDTSSAFDKAWSECRPSVFANMAHAAYHPGAWVVEKMAQLGARWTKTYERDGAEAFLTVWPDKAVLAFRGTEPDKDRQLPAGFLPAVREFVKQKVGVDLSDAYCTLLSNDLLADLQFAKVALDKAKVHKGFLGELQKLWKSLIVPDLESLVVEPRLPIYATGHSLGGAMATIAGMLHPFDDVVTFGEPRVGTHIDRAFQAAQHTRYVNGADPVTKVPPDWWPFDYAHHGEPIALVDPQGPDVRFDHSIVDYANKLRTKDTRCAVVSDPAP